MKKITVALTLTGALALTACGGVDGFSSEEAKEQAWHAYNCDAYGRLSAGPVAAGINIDILRGDIPTDEIPEAKRWERKLSAPNVDHVWDAMETESSREVTNMCTGWLWDRHTKESGYWDGYEEFSMDKAEDAGIIGNNN